MTTSDTNLPRQQARLAFHLQPSDDFSAFRPTVEVHADLRDPIAAVTILDGLVVQACDADVFRALAAACTEAADGLAPTVALAESTAVSA